MPKPQAIKYQETVIDPSKSVSEIIALVEKYGATRFEMQWENRQLTGIRFAVLDPELGEVPIWLRARHVKIAEILRKAASSRRSSRTQSEIEAQARRIAWRQLKDFTEQALLAVETGLFRFSEAFMSAVETEDEQGEPTTMGEMWHRKALLRAGGAKVLQLPSATGSGL